MVIKSKTLQIAWHADENGRNQPINGLDVHPTLPIIATCSLDAKVHIWRIKTTVPVPPNVSVASPAASSSPEGAVAAPSSASGPQASTSPAGSRPAADVDVEFLFALTGHMRTVNAVRFSPNGECLATASDDNTIIVWRPQGDLTWLGCQNERHTSRTCLRGHTADVYDLAWSPDSRQLLSGAVDRSARVWDVVKARETVKLEGHAQFVQGVAWEPAGHFIATQSSDRSVRVYRTPAGTLAAAQAAAAAASAGSGGRKSAGGKRPRAPKPDEFVLVATLKWRDMSNPATSSSSSSSSASSSEAAGAAMAIEAPPGGESPGSSSLVSSGRHALFLDDTFPSFFRRLAWSPEGSLLLVPCGMLRQSEAAPSEFCTHVFDVRGGLAAAAASGEAGPVALHPIAALPGSKHGKGTVIARACPVPWAIRAAAPVAPDNGAFALPGYRLLVAVASLDSVVLYDSQHAQPIAVVANGHCEKITDMVWSPDGTTLFVCSIDGYVSAISLGGRDTGEPLHRDDPAYPAVLKAPRPLVYLALEREKKAKAAAVAAAAAAASAASGPSPDGVAAASASPAAGEAEGDGSGVTTLQPHRKRAALLSVAEPAAGGAGASSSSSSSSAAAPAASVAVSGSPAPSKVSAASGTGSPQRRAALTPVAQ